MSIFLETLFPSMPWVLAAESGGKPVIETFWSFQRNQAAAFLRKHASVKVMMGRPRNRVKSMHVAKTDAKEVHYIGVRTGYDAKLALERLQHKPALYLNRDGFLTAVWRLDKPAERDVAEAIEDGLAERFKGEPLRFWMPVPGPIERYELFADRRAPRESLKRMAEDRCEIPPTVADTEAEHISWAWPQCFAYGKLNLIGGEPGVGKSQVTLYFAAALSISGALPDGSQARKNRTLIFAREDATNDTIRPRLEALGADLGMIHIEDMETDALTFADNWDKIRKKAEAIPDLGLIIFDPFRAFCDGQNPSVSAALTKAGSWAAKKSVCLLGIQHPPKGESANVQNLFGGTAAFMQKTRAAWFCLPSRNDPELYLMLYAKGNIIRDKRGYAYRLVSATASKGIETSRVVWEQERVPFTANDYLARIGGGKNGNGHSEPQNDNVKRASDRWATERLAGGPVAFPKLMEEGRKLGYGSSRTAYYNMLDRIGAEADGSLREKSARFPNLWKLRN